MLPPTIEPMLAAKADAPFDSQGHLFEIKWDGIRCLAFVEGGRVRLQSRQLTEITHQFPELAGLGRLPSGTVLDGELVVFAKEKPSLRAIQTRALLQNCFRIQHLSCAAPVSYMVFDLLFLSGKPLITAPLSERRAALIKLHEQFPSPGFLVSEGLRQCGRKLFALIMRNGLEGMMAKRMDGSYLPGKRCQHWLKIKPGYFRTLQQSALSAGIN